MSKWSRLIRPTDVSLAIRVTFWQVNSVICGVARGGVEPPTFRFSVGRSYQLSYLARLGSCYTAGSQATDRVCPLKNA